MLKSLKTSEKSDALRKKLRDLDKGQFCCKQA